MALRAGRPELGDDRAPGADQDPREVPAPWRVVRYLEGEALTPAIYFLFSRRATEEAASSCVALRPLPHAAELVREAKSRLADLSPEDVARELVARVRAQSEPEQSPLLESDFEHQELGFAVDTGSLRGFGQPGVADLGRVRDVRGPATVRFLPTPVLEVAEAGRPDDLVRSLIDNGKGDH